MKTRATVSCRVLCRVAKWITVFFALLSLIPSTVTTSAQSILDESDERVIHYESATNLADPVTILQKQLAAGGARLQFESKTHPHLP